MEKDLFSIGRVVKPHGVRGKIKIDYFGEDFSQFHLYRKVFIEDRMGRVQSYEVLEATPQPPRLILQLKDIRTVEEAQPLVGKEICIQKELLPDLPEGEYYWMEIIGMEVETEEGKHIGRIKEIFPTGAHDVYVVQGERREIFLPAVEGVIQGIDRERKIMKVTWMEGLWEKEDEV
ncbi:MAG: 16S rRNA processing protein RimM [Deltaproteobacteria bacterium RBG_16_48_10]|nr:MAG: 16S rRNA processing protein RimM [Deltaproteobacteria bacterium RBG_16_48_10]